MVGLGYGINNLAAAHLDHHQTMAKGVPDWYDAVNFRCLFVHHLPLAYSANRSKMSATICFG